MKVLAIDTSSLVASVALVDDDRLVAEYTINHKKTHSEKLMPVIDRLLEDCETDIADIDAIAVASGPGSFTGLRIGASTAKGLAHALNKPVIGISTLDGLACNLPYCKGLICPIMDARRNQVYTALYRWDRQDLCRIKPPTALTIEELADDLGAMGETVVFLGDGVPVHREFLQAGIGRLALFAPSNCDRQRASSIGKLAMDRLVKGLTERYDKFAPFYLRKSQAEREYEKKQRAKG
jgi:tRNA threonylcarbamoyladenosine biosynthesis protein TsaB